VKAKANKVLIVGASGFLGRALMRLPDVGLERVPTVRHAIPDLRGSLRLDLTNSEEVMAVVGRSKPAWVVNAAAETSVDRCEADPSRTRRVHVDGTTNLVRACEEAGAGLITISTNYVFDGEAGPYDEGDETNPLNVYGQTKLEAESVVLQASCQGVVVRAAVLYGYHQGSRPNFVTWSYSSLRDGKPIRVVTDECTNPTHVDELARFLLGLCHSDFAGTIHFAGLDYLSRYQMVERICDVCRLDFSLVTPVVSAALGQFARRPLQAGLRIDKLNTMFAPKLRSFEDHLRDLSEKMQS